MMLGHIVEILSLDRGESGGVPVAMLLVRSETERNPILLLFDQQQCVRVRDSLDDFLNDPNSWLHMSAEDQEAQRI